MTDEVAGIATRLAKHPFLAGMPDVHVQALAGLARLQRWPADTRLFSEHRSAVRFFLLEEGLVYIEMPIPGQEDMVLETVRGGEVLGWSWLFPPYVWHFSALTVAPTEAIVLAAAGVRERCEASPEFGYDLIRRVAGVAIQRLHAVRLRLMNLYDPTPPRR